MTTVQPMGGVRYHFGVVFQGGGPEDIVASPSDGGHYKTAEGSTSF